MGAQQRSPGAPRGVLRGLGGEVVGLWGVLGILGGLEKGWGGLKGGLGVLGGDGVGKRGSLVEGLGCRGGSLG